MNSYGKEHGCDWLDWYSSNLYNAYTRVTKS